MAVAPLGPFISTQPKQYDIHSNFGMFPGERLLYHNIMKSECCGCGSRYFVSVTDIRYVTRDEQICCWCNRTSLDGCVYLSDINQLNEAQEGCCSCCGCGSKSLEIYGSFGSRKVHIEKKNLADFEFMLSEAIGQHKSLT